MHIISSCISPFVWSLHVPQNLLATVWPRKFNPCAFFWDWSLVVDSFLGAHTVFHYGSNTLSGLGRRSRPTRGSRSPRLSWGQSLWNRLNSDARKTDQGIGCRWHLRMGLPWCYRTEGSESYHTAAWFWSFWCTLWGSNIGSQTFAGRS